MRALFLAMSSAGYGETLIGLSLARQIRDVGVSIHFIIPTTSEQLISGTDFPYTTLDPAMGPLAELIVDEVVAEWRPDVLVLSDYFTYAHVFPSTFGLDPWFIERYGIPLLPIDIWEWARSDLKVDLFIGKTIEVNDRVLGMDAALRPVPFCHADPLPNDRALPFRLFDDASRISARTRKHIRWTLGLNQSDRLVLLAFAQWQVPEYDDVNGNRVGRLVLDLLAAYLGKLPMSVKFAVVGRADRLSSQLPPDRTHVIPPCAPDRFNAILGAADLVVTLNLAAATLSRATLADIPGVALVNSHGGGPGGSVPLRLAPTVLSWLDGAAPLYPFRMFPLGFHRFMQHLVDDNLYFQAVQQAELLDQDAVVNTLEGALFDETVRTAFSERRSLYRSQLSGVPVAGEVFRLAAKAAGVREVLV